MTCGRCHHPAEFGLEPAYPEGQDALRFLNLLGVNPNLNVCAGCLPAAVRSAPGPLTVRHLSRVF